MSYHQVEDIIEDAIHLVAQAELPLEEGRDLIFNLYRFHDQHDTSYTRFRVLEQLKTYRYLYEWPLEKHPDYATHPAFFEGNKDVWLPVYVSDRNAGSVHHRNGHCFFEAGDNFWERVKAQLPAPDQAQSAPATFYRLLQIAQQQGEVLFVKRWYATFVNSILDYELDEENGIPKDFKAWLKEADLLGIRAFAQTHQASLATEDEDYEDDELLALPELEEELELATDAKAKAQAHFLLDVQMPLADLKAAYEADLQSTPDYEPYERAYTFFRGKLGTEWTDGLKEMKPDQVLLTFQKKQEHLVTTLIFEFDPSFKLLRLDIGAQWPEILDWQNRAVSPDPARQHFITSLWGFSEEAAIQADSHTSGWGGWKFNPKHSKATLLKRMKSLWSFYQKNYADIEAAHRPNLKDWEGNADSDQLMAQRAVLLERGIGFFGNEMDFKLFLATLNAKAGQKAIAQHYLGEVEALLAQGLGSDQLQRRIAQGIAYITQNNGHHPEFSNLYSPRLYTNSSI